MGFGIIIFMGKGGGKKGVKKRREEKKGEGSRGVKCDCQ